MYAIIAICRLCQEESLKGLKDQRHSTPFNQAWDKNLAPLAPWPPLCYLSKLGGGGGGGAGGCCIQGRGPAPPPPGATPPHYLSKLGGGGGWLEGVGGGGGGSTFWGGAVPKVGGMRATHYYHMHTSKGDVCLGVWGYGGMYVLIALSFLIFNSRGHAKVWVGEKERRKQERTM